MTNVYTNLITEIKTRLEAGITANKILAKDVFVGSKQSLRKQNDLPIIIIMPRSGRSTPETPIQLTDNVEFSVVYRTNRLEDNDNVIYNDTKETGLLYQLGHLLDYLELDGATIEMTFSGYAYNLINYNWNIDYSEETTISLVINFTVKTDKFTRGAR